MSGDGRPVILTFVAVYLPGYRAGGPLRSIANLVEGLHDEFRFRIVAGDRDLHADAPYPGLVPGRWHSVGHSEVRYLAPAERSLMAMARLLRTTPHDVLYLNSFFDPQFSILPLTALRTGLAPAKRVVLAPRGEFSPGALALKSFKKRAFMSAARWVGLHRGIVWQASSPYEAQDIHRALRPTPQAENLRIASDLPGRRSRVPALPPRPHDTPLRVVFLSRISPMKNLLGAIEILMRVRVPVRLTIHGPVEDAEYWSLCRARIGKLPPHISVVEGGPVEPAAIHSVLGGHDLFFLPTAGENFGHVIVEALQSGLRVLISDRTPWRGLSVAGVGHELSLEDLDAFARQIEAEACRPHDTLLAKRIERYLDQGFNLETVLTDNIRLLKG